MLPTVRVLKHARDVLLCTKRTSGGIWDCDACEEEHSALMTKHNLAVEYARENLLITWHYNNYCGWKLTSKGIDIFNQLHGDFS